MTGRILSTYGKRLPLAALAMGAALCVAMPAQAGQVLNTTSATSCTSQGGTVIGSNAITDFDNGTFGSESGAPNQSPSTDPYPATITGGVFDNFYNFNYGDYGYVANPVMPRNAFQHADITDPVYGATGRFFASDPNANTPTLNFTITNVTPFANYELSFWAANSEPNGTPNKVNAIVDGIVSYSTGDLTAFPAALEWRRHSFVFNAGDRTTILLAMASTETGSSGRDFYVDNVEMVGCTFAGGSISGRVYSDSNRNNAYNPGTDGTLSAITVQLWDDRGDGDPENDIFVSTITTDSTGQYQFDNIAPSSTYEVRVDTTDADLPTGATIGTPPTLDVTVTAGGNDSGNNFGFDLTSAALEGGKSVATYDPLFEGLHNIPGNDVIYTITILNRGDGPADNDSVVLIDLLPDDMVFYNGDMDDGGALTTDPVAFQQSGAGLNFVYTRDVGFTAPGPKPANFAACSYSPLTGYDSGVGYICFNPKGAMQDGNPDPSFSVSFRAQIK